MYPMLVGGRHDAASSARRANRILAGRERLGLAKLNASKDE
jgi:hypothetical protein